MLWLSLHMSPGQMLSGQMSYKQIFTYFQKVGFVAPGFEASKFLHKYEAPLWSFVYYRKLTIYD